MAELELNLVKVLDHLRISRVAGMGDGAGANIITRYLPSIAADLSLLSPGLACVTRAECTGWCS